MTKRPYCVYIMASTTGTIYVGITNNLERRVREHKEKRVAGFSAEYNCNRLVYYELFGQPDDAIRREKQIKGYRREKKVALIVEENPTWRDLSLDW